MGRFFVLPLELGSFGLPVVFAWAITPDNISAWGGAIAIIIGALFVGWANIIAAKAAARTAVKEVVAPIKESVSKIEAHVNSEKTRAEGEILNYKQQIADKDHTIEDLKRAAELLAQAKALVDAAKASSQGAVEPAAPQTVLKSIDQNTEETARNTERTDETVQELKDKTT